MGRKSNAQKELERQQAQQAKNDAVSASEVQNDNQIEVEIEEHKEPQAVNSLLERASKNLKSNAGAVSDGLSRTQKYKQRKKARAAAQTEDFSNAVIALLTLGITAWSIPENLKPNQDEVNAFSVPFVNILLRHFPIAGKMSADALDLIGILAAGSMYYQRTSQDWRVYNLAREAERVKGDTQGTPTQETPVTIDTFFTPPQQNENAGHGVGAGEVETP